MRIVTAILFVCTLLYAGVAKAAETPPDRWAAMQRLVGSWEGTSSGAAGEGSVKRQYVFIMASRYLHESNTSTYPPQDKNPKGEVHEHWGMFSFDKARQTLVLRQFHVEGFVNTYRRIDAAAGSPATLVFESESFENFNNAWKARETYEFASDDEFTETFELAPPGKPYQTYSRTHLKRVAR